jgi:hypothetical protein
MNDLSYPRVGSMDLCTVCQPQHKCGTAVSYAHRIHTVVFGIIRCEIYVLE